jgi:hypothetical protein
MTSNDSNAKGNLDWGHGCAFFDAERDRDLTDWLGKSHLVWLIGQLEKSRAIMNWLEIAYYFKYSDSWPFPNQVIRSFGTDRVLRGHVIWNRSWTHVSIIFIQRENAHRELLGRETFSAELAIPDGWDWKVRPDVLWKSWMFLLCGKP